MANKVKQNRIQVLDTLNRALDTPLTMEAIILNGEGPVGGGMDRPEPQEMPVETEHEPGLEDMSPQDKGSEKATLMDVKDEINQIRVIALKTIARLSDYPNSEGYNMMKKIWNMCDKAMEPAKEGSDNGGSSAV